ncbi:MAG TPA: polysaccharide biosynthesis/export family protein [Pirellulales bacterium]
MNSIRTLSKRRLLARIAIALSLVVLAWCSVRATASEAGPAGVPAAESAPNSPAAANGSHEGEIVLCQALGPAAPYPIQAIDEAENYYPVDWDAKRPMDWQPFAQGEYVGHDRLQHVPEYRLRVDDMLELVFRVTRNQTLRPYMLNVGDEVKIESAADPTLDRTLLVQPDGTITLPLIGQMKATRHTVPQLRDALEEAYKKYYRAPTMTVTPIKVNTRLEDLRATVDNRFGAGGQSRDARVTPEGSIALPAIGSVPAQGLTLGELKRELDERFALKVDGLEVTPVLVARAPRYFYVLGEVAHPGRFSLEGPTTTMQAISLAGGWNVGGNLRQVVIFRRGDDWRLMATMLDVRGALYAKVPTPADEVWLNDSDVVVVPKAPLRVFDDYVSLAFTQGLYSILPFHGAAALNMYSYLPGTQAALTGATATGS